MLDDHTREVMTRIKTGWSCFGRYKDILCDQKLPMCLKKITYDQCVISTITYGAKTWALTKHLEQKLMTMMTVQRAMDGKDNAKYKKETLN